MDFDWDIFNIEHIARHKVERDEAEEAVRDPYAVPAPTIHRGPQGQPRYGVIGETETGRCFTSFSNSVLGKFALSLPAQPPAQNAPTTRRNDDYCQNA